MIKNKGLLAHMCDEHPNTDFSAVWEEWTGDSTSSIYKLAFN